jgi:very-short-patch-repair endonuclease
MPGGFPTWSKENQEAFKARLAAKTTKRNLEQWQDPEYREKMLKQLQENGNTTWERHGEQKVIDLTNAARRMAADPVVRKKRSENQKQRLSNPEYLEACAKQCQEIAKSPEVRKVRSRTMTRLHESPEFRHNLHASWHKSPSKPEQALFDALVAAGVEGLQQQYQIDLRDLDIVHLPTKTNIEVDGPYWHQDKERDAKRDAFVKSHGWKVIRIELVNNEVPKKEISKLVRLLIRLEGGDDGSRRKRHGHIVSPVGVLQAG